MRWEIERDENGDPCRLAWVTPGAEEIKAREERRRRRRIASKRKPLPSMVEWAKARGLLDEDGCLIEKLPSTNVGREAQSSEDVESRGSRVGRGDETRTASSNAMASGSLFAFGP